MNTLDLVIWKQKKEQQRKRETEDNRLPLYVPDYRKPNQKEK